jgi:HK97 family phage portal protein
MSKSETKIPSLWERVKQLPVAIKGALLGEGSWRGPFQGMSELGNYFFVDRLSDGWQRNLELGPSEIERFGPVYACVAILSQELSRIPIIHYRINREDGSRTEVLDSPLYKTFHSPNSFQTRSDFILYLMRSLLLDGNGYAVAIRDNDFNIAGLYPVNPLQMFPYVSGGEVYYSFGDGVTQDLANIDKAVTWFPQRDVLHIRMHCPRHPLVGESPIRSVLLPASSGVEINRHTAAFFHNMSRPSGVLRHPGELDDVAMQRIKKGFMEITQSGRTGEPIILQENMDWKPLTMSAVDAELIASYKLTERQVAQVFRIPPFLLGDLEKATFQNVESLSRFFISSSLGFYVDHIEEAISRFFDLPHNEYAHFDVETTLMRTDLKERMEAYAKGVQNGILAPNEARSRESLPPVEYGEEPRVQQQLVPLSYGFQVQPPGVNPPPAEPEPEPEPTEEAMAAAEYVAQEAIRKAMEA